MTPSLCIKFKKALNLKRVEKPSPQKIQLHIMQLGELRHDQGYDLDRNPKPY
jgi:hypothetical protein